MTPHYMNVYMTGPPGSGGNILIVETKTGYQTRFPLKASKDVRLGLESIAALFDSPPDSLIIQSSDMTERKQGSVRQTRYALRPEDIDMLHILIAARIVKFEV